MSSFYAEETPERVKKAQVSAWRSHTVPRLPWTLRQRAVANLCKGITSNNFSNPKWKKSPHSSRRTQGRLRLWMDNKSDWSWQKRTEKRMVSQTKSQWCLSCSPYTSISFSSINTDKNQLRTYPSSDRQQYEPTPRSHGIVRWTFIPRQSGRQKQSFLVFGCDWSKRGSSMANILACIRATKSRTIQLFSE